MADPIPPLIFTYEEIVTADGEFLRVMVPSPAHRKIADRYTLGDLYPLVVSEDRSLRSHNHFFACVVAAWENLSEEAAEQYPTPDRLRKHALIRTGFRDERQFVCSSKAEAQRLAAFLVPIDPDAIIVVSESAVTEFRAKSQNMRAMGKQEFARSKDSVLAWLSEKIGVDVTKLRKAAAA